MAPLYMNHAFYDASTGYLTPEEPQNNLPLVDSPFETRQPKAVMEETIPPQGIYNDNHMQAQ